MGNPIHEKMERFSAAYGKELTVNGVKWHYYRLGRGPAIVWLTGAIRRAAYGFGFMELLAQKHTVIAPDYPVLQTFAQFDNGLTAILQAEGIERIHLGCQSYGGILAQPYLALHPEAVDRLVLSSTGPADYGLAWLPVESLAIGLARLLSEKKVKSMLAGGLGKILSTAPQEKDAWMEALQETFDHDLSRADVISHFAVAADLIKRRLVRPGAFAAWSGRAVALSAENDPTQGKGDKARYERLFGRPVEFISMGDKGHTAALLDPQGYVGMLEQALA
jgi:pimeloyl-ACP methyl ester carboxylesterase